MSTLANDPRQWEGTLADKIVTFLDERENMGTPTTATHIKHVFVEQCQLATPEELYEASCALLDEGRITMYPDNTLHLVPDVDTGEPA